MKCAKFVFLLFLLAFSCSPPLSDGISFDFETSNANSMDSAVKSILKSPDSPKSKIFRSISFSSDTKEPSVSPVKKPEKIKDLKGAMKYAYMNLPFGPISVMKTIDYDGPIGKLIADYNLPNEFRQMIGENLNGLKSVKISQNDLAAMILFLSYHLNIANHPDRNIFEGFYLRFIEKFATEISPAWLKYIRARFKRDEKRVEKSSAVNDLLLLAFSEKLYNTIEVIYSSFGFYCLRIFLKESIRCQDLELFKRFHAVDPTFKPEKIVIWAIEFENVPVYEIAIKLVASINPIAAKFKKTSLILHLAVSPCYFPGLADRVAHLESRFFDEALSTAIFNGNNLLFKEMIRNDLSFLEISFDNIIAHALKSVFWDNIPSLNLNSFVYQEDFEVVYNYIIQLQSSDPKILKNFSKAVPDMIRCGYYGRALFKTVLLDNRAYFKLLLSSAQESPFIFISENVDGFVRSYGISELVRSSNNYKEIIEELMNCKKFSILHAVGNPDFPDEFWPEIIEKHCDCKYIDNEYEYSELTPNFGFINDSDLDELDLSEQTRWTLLDLAILNFNYAAVKNILEKFVFSLAEVDLSKKLFESVKQWIGMESFYNDHLFPRFLDREQICEEMRFNHVRFFDENFTLDCMSEYQKTLSEIDKMGELLK